MRGRKVIVLVDSAEWNRVILKVALYRHSVSPSIMYTVGNHEEIYHELLQIFKACSFTFITYLAFFLFYTAVSL